MSVVFYWYLQYGAVSTTISLNEYVSKMPVKYKHLRVFPCDASGYIFYNEAIIELSDIYRPSSFQLYKPVKLEIISKLAGSGINGWV